MGRATLRAVQSDEYDEHSVAGAALTSRQALLEALRDKIASDIDHGVPSRDLASLSRRLLEISRELEGMADKRDEVTKAAATPDEPWAG